MVSAFFVVSGYLMMLTLSSNYGTAVVPFYWNRILRIYPLHIVLCCLIWIFFPSFVARASVGIRAHVRGSRHVGHGRAKPLLIPRYAGFFNKPAWTLPFELLYYILAPLIFRLGRAVIWVTLLSAFSGFCCCGPLQCSLEPFGLYWTASGTLEGVLGSALYFGLGALVFDLQTKSRWSLPQGAHSVVTWTGMLLLAAVLVLTLRLE